jgi:murein DD-endopeptidase MepM/ murein hydrolase activator NlpD
MKRLRCLPAAVLVLCGLAFLPGPAHGASAAAPETPKDTSLPAISVVEGGMFLVWERDDGPYRFVTFLGKSIPLAKTSRAFFGIPARSRVALVGVDFAAKPGDRELVLWKIKPEATGGHGVPVRILSRRFLVSRLTVKPGFVVPPESLLRRIRIEREAILAALSKSTTLSFSKPFLLPVQGRITHDFGAIRILNGKTMSRHSGEDIDAPEGTPVRAANDGTVALSGRFYYDGNMILVDHGGGLLTEYLHMSRRLVRSGERVVQGQVIGYVGHTGRVTGPVFHYGAVLNGQHINPLLLSEFPGERLPLPSDAIPVKEARRAGDSSKP